MKDFMILPALLLQKPSKDSKARENLSKLETRLEWWKTGNFTDILVERKTIQKKLAESRQSDNRQCKSLFKPHYERESTCRLRNASQR